MLAMTTRSSDDDLSMLAARVKTKAKQLLQEDADRESKRIGGKVGMGPTLTRILFAHYGVEDTATHNGHKHPTAERVRKRRRDDAA